MNLETIFQERATAWENHCCMVAYDSSSEKIKNCNSFREIVSMGEEALPLIRELYNTTNSPVVLFHGLPLLVKEILDGKFSIPKDIEGRVPLIRDYTKKWLDRYLQQFK